MFAEFVLVKWCAHSATVEDSTLFCARQPFVNDLEGTPKKKTLFCLFAMLQRTKRNTNAWRDAHSSSLSALMNRSAVMPSPGRGYHTWPQVGTSDLWIGPTVVKAVDDNPLSYNITSKCGAIEHSYQMLCFFTIAMSSLPCN